MTTPRRELLGETEETWQVYYSEREQREYYFHPKLEIVTWILPDDENYDLRGGSIQHAEMEAHDTHRNEIPRGFVVVDTSNKHPTIEPKMFSGQALTFVMLFVSAIVTGFSWGLYRGENHTTELQGRLCFDDPPQMRDTPVVVSTKMEYALHRDTHGDESLIMEREYHTQGQIPINILEDDATHCHELLADDVDEIIEMMPTSKYVDAISLKDGGHHHLGIENFGSVEGSALYSPRMPDESVHQWHVVSRSQFDSSGGDDKIGELTNQGLNSKPKNVGETADKSASGVAIAHARHRACNIPFAYVISRTCRLEVKDRPLFNVEALVDALVMQ